MGSLEFCIVMFAAFGEYTLLFAVSYEWVEHDPGFVRILTGHLVHIFSLARPFLAALHRLCRFQAHPLDRWRKLSRADLAELRTLAGVLPCGFCPDATLRRYCVQRTTASFKELKEATRFRERWRFRAREISHTLPVRHADGIARLGALSPLGGHSCDDPKEQDVSYQVAKFGRAANFEDVSSRYGAWLHSQGLPLPKQWRLRSVWGAIRRLPLAWSDNSRWHTIVEGNFKFREAIPMKEGCAALMCLRRAVAGTAGHCHRFLGLADNFCSLLAFDRGRSCSYGPALFVSPCSCSVHWR